MHIFLFLDVFNWNLSSCFQTFPWIMFTLHLLFQFMWQYIFVCCNWKIYMAIEVKQTVLFINFYIFWLLCLKWTSPSQGKHIFLGGMNHCWLIHLPLRAEARSGGSSCDVWVSYSGSVPLLSLQQLVKSLVQWMRRLPKSLTGGLSEVMNLHKGDWGMGWWGQVRKHQFSFRATHLIFTFSQGSVWTAGT